MNVKWNDIGNWDAIWEISKKDDFDNALLEIYFENSEDCL